MSTCVRQRPHKKNRPTASIGLLHRADQISTGRGVLWNNLPAHVLGTLWGTASGKLGGLFGVVPVFFGNVIFTLFWLRCHSFMDKLAFRKSTTQRESDANGKVEAGNFKPLDSKCAEELDWWLGEAERAARSLGLRRGITDDRCGWFEARFDSGICPGEAAQQAKVANLDSVNLIRNDAMKNEAVTDYLPVPGEEVWYVWHGNVVRCGTVERVKKPGDPMSMSYAVVVVRDGKGATSLHGRNPGILGDTNHWYATKAEAQAVADEKEARYRGVAEN